MINVELLTQEFIRANSYKLLSECYYPPDRKLINIVNNLNKSIKKGETFFKTTKSMFLSDNIDELSIDFSKLFIGPFKLLAPPYGSVYIEDKARVMGDTTINVRDMYRIEGLNICLKEAPDHIAIELEFMYLLILREIKAIEDNILDIADDYFRKQKEFLRQYLATWLPEFTEKIKLNAQTRFYKDLGEITNDVVEKDLKSLLNSAYFTKID